MKCPWIRHSNKELSKKIVLAHKQPQQEHLSQVSQVSSKISCLLVKTETPPSVETTINRQHLKIHNS